jgi:hypothetical protein
MLPLHRGETPSIMTRGQRSWQRHQFPNAIPQRRHSGKEERVLTSARYSFVKLDVEPDAHIAVENGTVQRAQRLAQLDQIGPIASLGGEAGCLPVEEYAKFIAPLDILDAI